MDIFRKHFQLEKILVNSYDYMKILVLFYQSNGPKDREETITFK